MDARELQHDDRQRRKRVLQHSLQAAPVYTSLLDRGHLVSGSTVQDAVVHSTYVQVHEKAAHRQESGGSNTVWQTGQLLGQSKNMHTAQHSSKFQQLQEARRHLEREAVQLRNTYQALKDKREKSTALEKLDNYTTELTGTLAERQARARLLARDPSAAYRSAPVAAPSSRRASVAFFTPRDAAEVQAQVALHSGLPAFVLPPGLQHESHDDSTDLSDTLKARSVASQAVHAGVNTCTFRTEALFFGARGEGSCAAFQIPQTSKPHCCQLGNNVLCLGRGVSSWRPRFALNSHTFSHSQQECAGHAHGLICRQTCHTMSGPCMHCNSGSSCWSASCAAQKPGSGRRCHLRTRIRMLCCRLRSSAEGWCCRWQRGSWSDHASDRRRMKQPSTLS